MNVSSAKREKQVMRGGLALFGGLVLTLSIGTVAQAQTAADLEGLPDAKAGECFAKVLVPAEYKESEQKVITREASSRIEVVPAKYEWVEETVTVRPAYQKLVSAPAKMKSLTETVVIEPGRKVWRTGKAARAKIAKDLQVASALSEGLPPDAGAGACYSQFFQPTQYEDKESQIVVREASQKIETSAPKYEWVEERVLVRDAATKKVEVPAKYKTVTEKVLVRAAYTTWKKGRGPIERVDNATGDIMCRVEVPAEYKEVKRRAVETPATTKTVEIPAEYKVVKVQKLVTAPAEKALPIAAKTSSYKTRTKKSDAMIGWRPTGTDGIGSATGKVLCRSEVPPRTKKVTRQVVATPAAVQKVAVPAKTKVVKRRKLVTAASEKKIAIPEESKMVTRREKVKEQKLAWQSVLCETNATAGMVTDIQRALKTAGHDPGPIDGVIGRATLAAVDQFQTKKGLARGGLTKSTLDALGVKLRTTATQ